MTFKEKVISVIEESLKENPSVFLINCSISESFKISVAIDGDNGVALQDCINLSRTIENNLDREEQDYSLEVASVGIGSPLKLKRQYKLNIGRMLIVKLASKTIEAELIDVSAIGIKLTWQAREQKAVGKGKQTIQKIQEIAFEDIKEAVVTVTF